MISFECLRYFAYWAKLFMQTQPHPVGQTVCLWNHSVMWSKCPPRDGSWVANSEKQMRICLNEQFVETDLPWPQSGHHVQTPQTELQQIEHWNGYALHCRQILSLLETGSMHIPHTGVNVTPIASPALGKGVSLLLPVFNHVIVSVPAPGVA